MSDSKSMVTQSLWPQHKFGKQCRRCQDPGRTWSRSTTAISSHTRLLSWTYHMCVVCSGYHSDGCDISQSCIQLWFLKSFSKITTEEQPNLLEEFIVHLWSFHRTIRGGESGFTKKHLTYLKFSWTAHPNASISAFVCVFIERSLFWSLHIIVTNLQISQGDERSEVTSRGK